MIKKIKNYSLLILTTLMLGLPGLVPAAVASAATTHSTTAGSGTSNVAGCDNNVTNGIAQGANGALQKTGSSTDSVNCKQDNANGTGSNITRIAREAVNLFSIVVGAVAVIMIIYGGFRYITSGGDSGNVGNAKNTLIYAVVGLIIVALAQIIVQFVLSQSSQIAA